MELFRNSSEEEYMNELEKLKRSELGTVVVSPVIEKCTEWLAIKAQLKTLEEKLAEVTEAGKTTVHNYNHALYRLLLRKIQESGKTYCELTHHVVSEVTTVLMQSSSSDHRYYLKNACSQCLEVIKAGGIVGCGMRYTLHETKMEGSIRMVLKDGVWKPVPKNLFWDHTSEDHTGWLEDKLLKAYGLPGKMEWTYHGKVFPPQISS